MSDFVLDNQLVHDTFCLGQFPLSTVLLMNNRQYPWLILVPKRPSLTEIYQLSEVDQTQLAKESSFLGQKLANFFSADKLNIGALGNLVSQLHIHHIVRYRKDESWPNPVWGFCEPAPYSTEQANSLQITLKVLLKDLLF